MSDVTHSNVSCHQIIKTIDNQPSHVEREIREGKRGGGGTGEERKREPRKKCTRANTEDVL
jgi:hypothetical protein